MSANTRDGDYGTEETAGCDEKLQPNCSNNIIIFVAQSRKLNATYFRKKLSLIVNPY